MLHAAMSRSVGREQDDVPSALHDVKVDKSVSFPLEKQPQHIWQAPTTATLESLVITHTVASLPGFETMASLPDFEPAGCSEVMGCADEGARALNSNACSEDYVPSANATFDVINKQEDLELAPTSFPSDERNAEGRQASLPEDMAERMMKWSQRRCKKAETRRQRMNMSDMFMSEHRCTAVCSSDCVCAELSS
eukprot:TRINITY_DN75516_c0_g1_i1.p1 TRINITY_DN75516_c0_g1~~TRINITY_DN75516_c0_g1_i1.p1  ORF type:complete len:194 (+),score=37.75 TRINITY_DN75516_c0_g1_i1:204-785(+)